jgi:hypothetical protein
MPRGPWRGQDEAVCSTAKEVAAFAVETVAKDLI